MCRLKALVSSWKPFSFTPPYPVHSDNLCPFTSNRAILSHLSAPLPHTYLPNFVPSLVTLPSPPPPIPPHQHCLCLPHSQRDLVNTRVTPLLRALSIRCQMICPITTLTSFLTTFLFAHPDPITLAPPCSFSLTHKIYTHFQAFLPPIPSHWHAFLAHKT